MMIFPGLSVIIRHQSHLILLKPKPVYEGNG